MTRVLVTGARGKTGVPMVELLLARGRVEVLAGSSDPAAVNVAGARPTAFSWDDPSGWPAATAGVDAVYVVRPDRPDAPELVRALLDAAPGDARVVLLSEREADYEGLDGWALRVEGVVRQSGRGWTILRPSWFMQVFTDPRFYRDAIADGELAFPSGGASVAWIDAVDIAAVGAHALLEEGHAGQVYELSGPEALSLPRTAELLSAAAGHPVAHRELTVDDAVAGSTGWARAVDTVTFDRVRSGAFSGVTDTVERVTGRPARTLEAFLADSGQLLHTRR
ncbi:NAD(P)H-binding protein [Motilibacter aurantiacus]|uniref:NAD(P)H-binding protein n=1 Tax=Motilibacter aurantiacus TaxID=2714955 RepID=UPI00140916B0|nr:NAD(P)H-binding protein [Motilibacter aurantiacus]NHC43684.1 NAD(P)H-binding protein [Motilibacter aurantiacus]